VVADLETMSIDTLQDVASAKRLVVKIGSALLIENGEPAHEWLATLAQEIADLRAKGTDVVVVSSGAIALGAAQLDLPKGGRACLADAQAAASVGQVALAQLWGAALEKHGFVSAQMLVTLDDLEGRKRYLNACATLERLLEAGVIPVVNENDSVATAEIRFGDNDRLASRVAQAAKADAVLLLSDVDGLYDRDPSQDGAQLIEQVAGVTPEVIAMAGAVSPKGMGSGGMLAKLQAARIAERAGIALAIINGTHDTPIAKALDAGRGTVFLPVRSDNAHKAWIGGMIAPEGVLSVDAGCVAALQDGASLLAAGLIEVEGEFARGALVSLHGPKGERLGQGIVEYSSEECAAIAGLKNEEQEAQLGYAPRAAVVHRDHMVQG